MNDIPKIFNLVRIILVVITIASTAIAILVIKIAFDTADVERNNIYIADTQHTLKLALANDVWINRPAEAEAHVRRFHELFFVLSPDPAYIENSMEKAMYIGDKSVKNQYTILQEKKYFDGMIANGISSEFMCDSIQISESEQGFDAKMYGKTSLVYSDKIIFKKLITTCSLVSSQRDVYNPNGFIIVDWKIVNNDDIRIIDR